jgi:hypothetical protein
VNAIENYRKNGATECFVNKISATVRVSNEQGDKMTSKIINQYGNTYVIFGKKMSIK